MCRACGAANVLHFLDTARQSVSLADADLQIVIAAWEQLPEAVRTAIAMLVRANVTKVPEATT